MPRQLDPWDSSLALTTLGMRHVAGSSYCSPWLTRICPVASKAEALEGTVKATISEAILWFEGHTCFNQKDTGDQGHARALLGTLRDVWVELGIFPEKDPDPC